MGHYWLAFDILSGYCLLFLMCVLHQGGLAIINQYSNPRLSLQVALQYFQFYFNSLFTLTDIMPGTAIIIILI